MRADLQRLKRELETGQTVAVSGVSPETPQRRSLKFGIAIGVVAVAIVAGFFLGKLRGWLQRDDAAPIHSLAILPLQNLSGDAAQDYFADGMTEELITQLSQISAARVSSRTSSMRYKGTQKSIPQIARELGVDAIVEGSVLRSGNRVRITAQLIAGSSDKHLWAESYERDLGDILKLQSEVSEAIVRGIKLQLTPEEQSRLHASREVNSAAYESYLQGRFYITNGTSGEIEKAQAYLKKAIALDPRFAPAYAGLADTYLMLGTYRMIPPQQAHRQSYGTGPVANGSPRHSRLYQMAIRMGLAPSRNSFAKSLSPRIASTPTSTCAGIWLGGKKQRKHCGRWRPFDNWILPTL
jgi:TolB-like protein